MANKVINTIKNIPVFLVQTRGELKKVQWPSRDMAIKYTLIVIGASLVVALFLGGLDYLFTYIINNFII